MINIGLFGSGRICVVHGRTLRVMSSARSAAASDFIIAASESFAEAARVHLPRSVEILEYSQSYTSVFCATYT